MTKKALTQSDLERLDAARGLDLHQSLPGRPYQNKTGLMPSVEDYNKAVRQNIFTGILIVPVGASPE